MQLYNYKVGSETRSVKECPEQADVVDSDVKLS